MKKIKLLFILIIILLFAGLIYYSNGIKSPNPGSGPEELFVIEKGQGIDRIAENLQSNGFIANKFIFKIFVAVKDYKAKFLPGNYNLRTDLSIKDLVEQVVASNEITLEETEILLIEGWTVAEMDNYLSKNNVIEPGSLVEYSEIARNGDYDFLNDRPKSATLEGFLYPDTYRIYKDATVEKIVQKMLDNFDQKLTPEMRAQIDSQNKTIFEVVTLASIVEQEMFGYEDRKIVAGIFNNRLDIGMALQSDATVNYITKKGIAAPSLDDIAIDNQYNTYKYPGLPPGPICNPSIEAINAVINAADTDYMYFLTTEEGEIIYSKTHDEHVRNKAKYLN